MNKSLIIELEDAIKQIKKEIINKQQQLDDLIDQYQNLAGISTEENILEEDNLTCE